MSRTLRFTLILIVLLSLWGGIVAAAQEPVVIPDAALAEPELLPLHPTAPLEVPTPLILEENVSFAHGGGFLYWENDCIGSVEAGPVYIRRRAENGGVIQTLYEVTAATHDQCESVSRYNVADDDGFFYLNHNQSRLEARLTDDPGTAINIASISNLAPVLVTDENRVYYNQSGGIYRANKDSFGGVLISDATNVTGMAVDDTYIYWLDDTGLWRSSKTCTSSTCWNNKEQLSTIGGEHLTWEDEDKDALLWVDHSGGNWKIMHKVLSISVTFNMYWASDAEVWGIGRPVYHDGCLFWLENTMYDVFDPPNNLLRRMCAGPSSVETIGEELIASDMLSAGMLGVVFGDASGIYYLSFDAAPILKDFGLDGMEVTQGIQNMYNDVSLVAEKTTYVRVFGTLTADRRADAVPVALHGSRGGVALPGSPLYSVNGPRPMIPGDDWDRSNAEDNWLFQLPRSWIASGDLHLEAEIDPRGVYDDPSPGNNTLSDDVTFYHRPPLCIVFLPVRTHAGKGSTSNPLFGPMVNLSERLLPVPAVHTFSQSEPVEELQICWKWGFIPYPCWGPYELDEEGTWDELWRDDESSVLDSIATRWLFSDDPDVCDDAGANTHYVGMVHPDSATMGGTTTGMGRYASYASWVKFPSPSEIKSFDYPWTWPHAGGTLAHELGHNYERYHVDCGGPDSLDNGYPYSDGSGTACVLDDGSLTSFGTHFGFDINTQAPIKPNISGMSDLMSYSSKRWISDYTWEALFSRVDDPTLLMASAQPTPVSPEQVDLASGDSVVLVSGVITPSASQGRLSYAWVYPTDSLSDRVLQKWQTLAVPGGYAPTMPPPPPAQYHIRLRDANGAMLSDHPFDPELVFDGSSDDEKLGFVLTFPAPTIPAARIDLMIYDTVVYSMLPGASVPSVQILQPAGGETFDDQMTIVWQATDADIDDRLLYNVQYSPDLGQTWRAVVTNWPGLPGSDTVTLTLDILLGLPGSTTGGLVRVAASDGYNTGMATSASFAVSNQAPQPYIVSPAADQLFEAGDMVMLLGGAADTEDGSLSGEALSWDVTGRSTITGTEAILTGLAPGDYDVVLTAEDSDGLAATAQTTLTVSPLGVPDVPYSVDDPELDGFCDDDAYASGPLIALRPYPDGSQGAVHLVRSDDYLWACFSGLNRGSESMMQLPMNSAGLVIDANYSHETQLQANDYWFYVQEDGTPTTWAGPAWGGGGAGPGGLLTRISANDNAWNAELRIDASVIGGWGHAVGLELLHVWVPQSGGSHYSWPYKANSIHPDTWATTVLGEWPRIDSIAPNEATEDSSDVIIFVTGENFDDDAVALWNGESRTTVVLSDMLLMFSASTADLAMDGTAEVRVQNPGLETVPSNAMTFLIKNPVPEVTSLTPDEATAGESGYIIGVSGQDFDNGAVALWNGEPMTTTVTGSTFLMFSVDASNLATERYVAVSVLNPEPGGGLSNPITFTVLAPPNQVPDAPINPNPAHGASNVPTDQVLTWQGSDPDGQPLHYDIAFGTSSPPPVVASSLAITTYNPGQLDTNTTYYWRITVSDGLSTTVGSIWSFATASTAAPNRAPKTPYKPNPSDDLSDVPVDQVLIWQGGDPDGDPVTYTIALGTSNPPPVVATDLSTNSYDPPTLVAGATYYWAITATDGLSTTAGPVWSFTTAPSNYPPYTPYKPSPSDEDSDVSLNPLLIWQGGDPDDDPVTYSVGMGTSLPLAVVATGLTDNSYAPPTLTAGTRYYWSVRASDGVSTTTGPVWSFTIIPANQAPYMPYKPSPADHASDVPTDQVLTWRSSDPDRDPLTYTIALGTSNPPPVVATDLSTASYDPPTFTADVKYYWVVTVTDGLNTIVGPTWSFMTATPNRAPYEAYAPYPADRAADVPVDQVLSWQGSDPDKDTLTYDVRFGTSYPPPVVTKHLTATVYDPGPLAEGASYYWSVNASDGISMTIGTVWRFQTTGATHIYLPLVLRQQ
jgi:hypothetical protein